MKLDRSFYLRNNVVRIARELVGKSLHARIRGISTSGMIVETEAYSYKERGSHAFRGMTPRNAVMFGEGGHVYVYLCYGVHHLFNVVTNKAGLADAVLVRALQPMDGEELMAKRVGGKAAKITAGPGKLSKAMGFDRRHNGIDLCGDEIWLEDMDMDVKSIKIKKGPRIGVEYAGKDASLPWRFWIAGNPWVSKP
jgi:DNA-3-methyladenine glycosylase